MTKSASYRLASDFFLEEMVDALNQLLPGNRLHIVSLDTADGPHAEMEPDFTHMDAGERVRVRHLSNTPDSHRYLEFPIGMWILVPFHPAVFKGQQTVGSLEIKENFVIIRAPYLYGIEPDRVDVKHYAITVLGPLKRS